MAEVTINGNIYQVHSESSEKFRCGKTSTTVILRKPDTEIEITTSGDWRQLMGVNLKRLEDETSTDRQGIQP